MRENSVMPVMKISAKKRERQISICSRESGD